MMKRTLILSTVILAGLAQPVWAAPPSCFPRDEIVKQLEKKHDESQRLLALSKEGKMVEFWGSDDGRWTLLVTQPSGLSCIVGAGTDFQILSADLVGQRS